MYGKRLPKSSYQTVISYAFTSSYSCEIQTMVCVLQLHWLETPKLTWSLPLQPPTWADPPWLSPLRCLHHLHDSLGATPLTRHPLAQGTVSLLVLTHPLGAFQSAPSPADRAFFWLCVYSCHPQMWPLTTAYHWGRSLPSLQTPPRSWVQLGSRCAIPHLHPFS